MQQRRNNRIKVKPHISKDIGNSNRMNVIGLARGAGLAVMRFHAKYEGTFQLVTVD